MAGTGAAAPPPAMEHVRVSVDEARRVGHVTLAREAKSNALNLKMWGELATAIRWVGPRVHCVVLHARGANFCAGIDLQQVAGDLLLEGECPARTRNTLLSKIKYMQACFTAFEECPTPVVAAVDGAAYGAAVDLLTCCDLRYCTTSARFCIKEVDVGITADVGTLQRLPRIVGDGVARELCLTARPFDGAEALRIGFVAAVLPSAAALTAKVEAVASSIAAKSPLAVQGTKAVLIHARDHTVVDGLDYVATRNSAQLISADIVEAVAATRQKRPPVFSRL